jgi:NADPH:quinone reductase-like Zn-dependent oxidoreductase
LVIGAAGAVGGFAVQLAKAFAAQVTGVGSTTQLDLVRSIGADDVVDYTRQDVTDGTRQWDLIIDTAGRRSLSQLRRALTPTGTLVIVGGEGVDSGGSSSRQASSRHASAGPTRWVRLPRRCGRWKQATLAASWSSPCELQDRRRLEAFDD